MAQVIDGKTVAAELRESMTAEVAGIKAKYQQSPCLAVVLVGDDPASAVYVRMKKKGCEEVGVRSLETIMPTETTTQQLLDVVTTLNRDTSVNGILVQLPLPKHIDEQAVLLAINPAKDVDGFHPMNVGKLVTGDPDCFLPCTPAGCQELIARAVPDLAGKHLVIVGRSNIVGKPLANMMVQKAKKANCVVTVCHTGAPDIAQFTRLADILVVAAGRPKTVTASMVKPGAVVIDVGVNRIADPNDPSKTKLVGDVDYEGVAAVASAITPVPGGVGPMTITMLLQNTVKAWKIQNQVAR